MKRAVLVGGFMTSEISLGPVINEMERQGVADEFACFCFPDVMDDEVAEDLRKAVDRALVVTHSAGIMAIRTDMQPESLVACAGPTPRNVGRLLLGAAAKTVEDAWLIATDSNRVNRARVLADNVWQAAVNWPPHLPHIARVSRFSTANHIANARDGGVDGRIIMMDRDRFFPLDLEVSRREVPCAIREGGHDELLTDPLTMVANFRPDAWQDGQLWNGWRAA